MTHEPTVRFTPDAETTTQSRPRELTINHISGVHIRKIEYSWCEVFKAISVNF